MKKQYQDLPKELLTEGHQIQKNVSGISMIPTIPENSVVRIVPVEQRTLKLGDIVYFSSDENRAIIHRISRTFKRDRELFIQTWGDNCLYPDSPVSAAHIHGRVIACTFDGTWQTLDHNTRRYFYFFIKRYLWYYLKKTPRLLGRLLSKTSMTTLLLK